MYDSDGGGFFAVGLLMMFLALGSAHTLLENIVWLFVGLGVVLILMMLYMNYGFAVEDKFNNWYESIVQSFLKLFGLNLYDKKVWAVFCIFDNLLMIAVRIGLFILVLLFLAYGI